MGPGHGRPNEGKGDHFTVASQQAYFERWLVSLERLMDERDRRYDERFRSLDSATEKALAAVQNQTAAAFLANKESVAKTEDAQKAYNFAHNDLTRKMEAQSAKFVDRERLDDAAKQFDTKIEALKSEIKHLQAAIAETGGRHVQQQETKQQLNWSIGQAITIALVIAGLVVGFIEMLLKGKP